MSAPVIRQVEAPAQTPDIAPAPLLPRGLSDLMRGIPEYDANQPPVDFMQSLDDGDSHTGESTQSRRVDALLLERTRDDVTETAPTRRRSESHPPPHFPEASDPGPEPDEEPITRSMDMPETIVRSDLGEHAFGAVRRTRTDRPNFEEPSGERERPGSISYAAPVPSFDDVGHASSWDDDDATSEEPRVASYVATPQDTTESTVTELPNANWPVRPAEAPMTAWPSRSRASFEPRTPTPYEQAPSSLPSLGAFPAGAFHGGAFAGGTFPAPASAPADAPPGARAPAVSTWRPPARMGTTDQRSVPGAMHMHPASSLMGHGGQHGQHAALAYASSPVFQPRQQPMTVSVAPPAPKPGRVTWFLTGAAFASAFFFFATGFFAKDPPPADEQASVAPPTQAHPTAASQAPVNAQAVAPRPLAVAPPARVISPAPVATTTYVAPPAEPPAPRTTKATAPAARHASKTTRAPAAPRREAPEAPEAASTDTEAMTDALATKAKPATRKKAPAADSDTPRDTPASSGKSSADVSDLLGAALAP